MSIADNSVRSIATASSDAISNADNTTSRRRHRSLHKFLEANPTPPSKDFDYSEWRSFSIESFTKLVNEHPEVAIRMIRFVFQGKEVRSSEERSEAKRSKATS